ncbi:hypothetical protein FIV42_15520 [Persicimonas caeni]|uniref:Uncharacterized protein n=2 Tax=Persicimonas caeni TaxID=2292766 RepID=A0A4Y6PV26_PERCE|nr:hypothetical protein FIV42_15520 [Persicimonas caeni]
MFGLFVGHFGMQHGRLIFELPSNWKAKVYEACGGSWRKRQMVDLLRRQLGRKAFVRRRDTPFDSNEPWLQNALSVHADGSVHAIVSTSAEPKPGVLRLDDLHDGTEQWRTTRSLNVPRTTEAMVDAVRVLLGYSQRVRFVDPYFNPNKRRFTDNLNAFLQACGKLRGKNVRCEIHSSTKPGQSAAYFERQCRERLRSPHGVRVVRWQARTDGQDFHDRFILTDIGGVKIGHGLDHGQGRDSTTTFSLLERETWAELQGRFDDARVYDLADECRVAAVERS